MNTRNIIYIIIISVSFQGFSMLDDWGKTGHRVTGEIANNYLTKKAKKHIDKLLKGQGLALVSIYADEIKSDDTYRKYSSWHYVNFSFDKKYGEDTPSDRGDLVTGIQKCIDVLKNNTASKEDKEFYLKMLVHLIGDLHQPLHVGRGEDKGGNDIQVNWFRNGSNLHRVWDSEMIDYYKMSYTELANNADRLSSTQLGEIQKGDILDWIYESQNLAKKVYASADIGEKIGYEYMYVNFPTVRSQLQKGGIRLAKILNDIFG